MKNMYKWTAIALAGMITFSACNKEDDEMIQNIAEEEISLQLEPTPKAEIDQMIFDAIQKGEEFNWSQVSDHVLWSALIHGDSIITIGYQTKGGEAINQRLGEIDIKSEEWVAAKNKLYQETTRLLSIERKADIKLEDIPHKESEYLPYIDMKVFDKEVISSLRKREDVRYIEPTGYQIDLSLFTDDRYMSSSGCSNEPNYSIPTADYTVVSPNAKASWHFDKHGIRQAWTQTQGAGVTVAVIDTGLSPDQAKMNSQFASGESGGRTVQRYGFHQSGMWWWKAYDGPDDGCGHGTAMAGVIAAPKSTGGSSVGVAYRANLVSARGTEDVVINSGSEKDGVAEALIFLGNRSDVKVISMSIGDVFSNGKVSDAIRYAHNRGKLIFAAAGTSTSFTNWFGVIFPASMNETVAVTGIKESQYYERCNTCHSGDKVDFTIMMERAGTNNHALTTAMSGNQPATVGGSSVATATAAGIATLVWSKYPNWTRQQVLDRLTQTAHLYPNRNGQFGWGMIDANAAVSDVVAKN